MACGSYPAGRWQGCQLPVLALTGWQLTLGGLCPPLPLGLWEPPLPALSLTQGPGVWVFIAVWRAAGLCAVVSRHCSPAGGGGVSSLSLLSPLSAAVIERAGAGPVGCTAGALAGWFAHPGRRAGRARLGQRRSRRVQVAKQAMAGTTRRSAVQIRTKTRRRAQTQASSLCHRPAKSCMVRPMY